MNTEIDVFQFKTGADFLKCVYAKMRESNPRFSRRAFAAKLGMDQSMLTRYFGGVRPLSSERVEDISRRLELSKAKAQYFKVISLLGDRGEMEILDILRQSILSAGPFDIRQVMNCLQEAGWWQFKNSEIRQKILRRIFSMTTSSESELQIQTDTFEDTEVKKLNQVFRLRKEDRQVVEKSLSELHQLLNSFKAEKGDDFLIISTVNIKITS